MTEKTSTLHEDDQAVLNRFRAEEAARLDAIEACKEAAVAAKNEMDALNKQIAEEEAQLKKDQGRLGKDKKELDREALKKRKAELELQKKKIAEEKTRSKELAKSANRKCQSPLPNSRNCVQKDPKTKMEDPLGGVADLINNHNGTKIDFDKLVAQEGAYSGAYVPWWPIPKNKDTYTMTVKYPRSDDPKGTIPVIAGDNNHSGVSIGVGIDFGDQDKERYYRDLDLANKKFETLSTQELEGLKKKIDPYFGKMRSEACEFLRKNPLELSRKEMDLLHLRAANNAINAAKKQNSEFGKLSVDEQTAIFKKIYNRGS